MRNDVRPHYCAACGSAGCVAEFREALRRIAVGAPKEQPDVPYEYKTLRWLAASALGAMDLLDDLDDEIEVFVDGSASPIKISR